MIIYSNPYACAGTAARRWKSIASESLQRLGSFTLIEAGVPNTRGKSAAGGILADADRKLLRALQDGETCFVAAGGDGTVNHLVGLFARHLPPHRLASIRIGAIGMGSSNDFHKSSRHRETIGRFPCRLDFEAARLHDLGVLTWSDGKGKEHHEYWINNASLGVTAEANYRFNHPSRFTELLKKNSTEAAIMFTALKMILLRRTIEGRLTFNGAFALNTRPVNIGIVRNPHFSGSFCYDSPVLENSGTFFVHLCETTSRLQTLAVLYRLSRSRFRGSTNTRSYQASAIHFSSALPFTVEYDGETLRTCSVSFTLITNAVLLCP